MKTFASLFHAWSCKCDEEVETRSPWSENGSDVSKSVGAALKTDSSNESKLFEAFLLFTIFSYEINKVI